MKCLAKLENFWRNSKFFAKLEFLKKKLICEEIEFFGQQKLIIYLFLNKKDRYFKTFFRTSVQKLTP